MNDPMMGFVPALAQALLHFLWQGAAIGACAALALRVLRQAQPQTRYAVACLALLACLLIPLATLIATLVPATISDTPLLQLGGDPSSIGAPTASGTTVPLLDASLHWIVLLWALGACIMAIRIAFGLTWLRALRASHDTALQTTWQRHLDALAQRFDLRRRVELRIVEGLDTPASIGWWRPIVLLPAAVIARMPADLIEALLAHELAHIRRHDYLVNLIQTIVEALLFYHPVVWWLSRRIRIEREEIADQVATELACPRRRLACALFELSELQSNAVVPMLAQAAHGGRLMARIERLVRPSQQTRPTTRIALALMGLMVAGIASYAYAQANARSAEPATASPVATRSRDTFALVRDQRVSVWGPRDSADTEALAQDIGGDYLWIHHGGVPYVVVDASLVARARRAWERRDAVDRQFDAVEREIEAQERTMSRLDARLRAILARPASPELAALTREVKAATEAREALERRGQALQRAQDQSGADAEQELKRVFGAALANGLTARATARTY